MGPAEDVEEPYYPQNDRQVAILSEWAAAFAV
jgi:hypothetical protein